MSEGRGGARAGAAESGTTGAGADGSDLRVGVDIGGTFTDFVLFDPAGGGYRTFKVLSTPEEPSRAVVEGLAHAGAIAPDVLVHGSTVATNAVLERRGARTALVTTRGFGDLLSIARQDREAIYDLFADRPEPLVPRELCFEVEERVSREGEVLAAPTDEELERVAEEARATGAESVAVCFLFSFLRPEHEERAGELLERAGFHVSLSSRILPEFREYERASTTAVNAYVEPLLDRYLGRLEEALSPEVFRVMQSNGGSVGASAARSHGVRSVLSGPAAGALGALRVARAAGEERSIAFDMGGTSTDVSLLRGTVETTSDGEIAGLPVRVPMLDIHTVGAGGGSIARVDPGGALRVGPESAGADPGPVCYGLGGRRPTVTDANLVLGRIPGGGLLGGELELREEEAGRAMTELAEVAGIEAPEGLDRGSAAALGVVRVANAHMERALRVISVERGHEPADFALVSFGGAGGLHACELARRLGIGVVLVPRAASVLSAYGMLSSDVVKDYVRTVMLPGDVELDELEGRAEPLRERGRAEVAAEGVPVKDVEIRATLDVRYVGQSYELEVPLTADFVDIFHREHRSVYGHAEPAEAVEVVNLRVRATGRVESPGLPQGEEGPADPSEARTGRHCVVLGGGGSPAGRDDGANAPGMEEISVFDGEALRPGHRLPGPCVVTRPDTTIFLGPGDVADVDRHFNLRIRIGSPSR